MSGDPPSKQEQLLKLLDRGSVFVHLDPRRDGVIVPEWFSHKPQLVLQLGRNFAIPIPDLEIDDYGVCCTLSFNRSPFHCTLPWTAVYALVAENGEVTMWPSELPMELVPEPNPVRRNQPTSRGGRGRQRPKISVVPSPTDGGAAQRLPESRPTSFPPPPRLEDVSAGADTSATGSRSARANESGSIPPKPSNAPKSDGAKPARPAWLRLVK